MKSLHASEESGKGTSVTKGTGQGHTWVAVLQQNLFSQGCILYFEGARLPSSGSSLA